MNRLMLAFLCFPGVACAQLTPAFQMSGNLGYELVGFGQPGMPFVQQNSVALSMNVPGGATPVLGFIYTNDYLGLNPMGQPIGGGWIDISVTGLQGGGTTNFLNVQPFASGPATTPVTWSYGVPLAPNQLTVGPNAPYSISAQASAMFGNSNQMHGAGLLAIYQSPLLPMTTLTVYHGVEVLGNQGVNMQSVIFAQQSAMIGAGSGTLSVLTFGDDSFNSGETIDFNGTTIATNIDGNLGNGGGASIFNLSVTTVGGGQDQATITTQGDLFGWHLAVLQSPVPTPGSVSLAAISGLFACRRRRR